MAVLGMQLKSMGRAIVGSSSIFIWAWLTLAAPTTVTLYLTYVYRCSLVHLILSILPLPVLAIKSKVIFDRLSKRDRDYILNFFIIAGRGLKPSIIKFKNIVLLNLLNLLISLSIFTFLHLMLYGLELSLVITISILALSTIFVHYLTHIVILFIKHGRQTAVDIEAPYFFILVRVLSSISIPFYDILSIAEKSVSLKAFAKEIRFARKIATLKNLSLLTALDTLCQHHPSNIVREYVRRIAIAASSTGDIVSVAEASFEAVYTMFESKVSMLIERFTIVIGTALFVYTFIPVIIAVLAPTIGGGIYYAIVVTFSLQVLTFFILYGIITYYYPSSLVIRYNRSTIILTITSLMLVILLNTYSLIYHLVSFRSIDLAIMYIVSILLLVPGAVVSEKTYRQALLYDRFTRTASDAASLSVITGENYLSVLERLSAKYGEKVARLVKRIATSYTSETLRKAVVHRAPSIFHTSFIEILTYILLYGASPVMLKPFVNSYERIVNIILRTRSLATSIEIMLVTLSAIIGGFIAYLDKVFRDIHTITMEIQFPGSGFARLFTYNPLIYGLLDALTIFSLILISLFIGKIRGGALAFSFRSTILTLLLYITAKLAVQLLLA